MKFKGFFSDKPDMALLVGSIIASIFGIITINSASATMPNHIKLVLVQSVALLLGLGAMTVIIYLKYTHLEKLKYLVFGVGIGLLVLVLAIGKLSNGTQGWFVLGPITIQPAEIAKICFIVTMSLHLSLVKERVNEIKTLVLLIIHLSCYVVPVLLQPDFGTAIVFLIIFTFQIFFANIARKYILYALGAVCLIAPIVWLFLVPYQKNRILSLFTPEKDPTGSGYHILQSQLAIGSGQIWGRGYLKGPQTQFGYLPEKQTDFAFSVIGEEFGLIGTIIVTTLLFIIIYRCFDNARSCSHDPFGELICVGVGAMLFFHTLENIGMCIGLLPITGIPLPFISYGGSNLVTCFCAIGLVQNVVMRRRAGKFNL